jgi:hypothetical protein
MSNLESMSDDTLPTFIQHVLEYVTLLTNLEGSAPSAPTLTRKEIIEATPPGKNPAPPPSPPQPLLTAATAAATAAEATQHRGKVTRTRGHEATQPAAQPRRQPAAPRRARCSRRGERRSELFVGRFIPWHNCHGGAWNETLLITHTCLRIE